MRLSAFAVAFLILGSVGIGNCQTLDPSDSPRTRFDGCNAVAHRRSRACA